MDRWEFEEQALTGFLLLERDDPSAFRYIAQLLERWAQAGADSSTDSLKAPVGKRVFKRIAEPPWLGEIREAEFPDRPRPSKPGKQRQYRLYFLDISGGPNDPDHMMLISLYAEKRHLGSSDQQKVRDAQDRDMLDAMYKGKEWCRKNRRDYRPWTPPVA